MKIIQFMPEFGLAGAETMCENLTYELLALGHDVTVVSLYNYHSPITERLIKDGVNLIFLGKKSGLDISVIRKIRQIIKKMRPDIVHTHLYLLKYVFVASINLNIKIVHTVHNIAQKENNAIDRFINGFLFRQKYATPVALSEVVKKTITDTYRINQEDIPIVLNGTRLKGGGICRDYILGESIKIIHIGRYTTVKNHANLIVAVSRLHQRFPNIQLHLYGDGELKSAINNQIKDLKADKYIFDNGLTDNAASAMNNADIFVLPSIYEGVPMTIIEAMDSALPIVASNVGGIPDMIDDGNDGIICTTDADSIYNNLLRVIEDQELRASIGRAAKIKAEKFSATTMAHQYERIYKQLVQQK